MVAGGPVACPGQARAPYAPLVDWVPAVHVDLSVPALCGELALQVSLVYMLREIAGGVWVLPFACVIRLGRGYAVLDCCIFCLS